MRALDSWHETFVAGISSLIRHNYNLPWGSYISYMGVAGLAILMFFALSRFGRSEKDDNKLGFGRLVIQILASVGTGIAIIWISSAISIELLIWLSLISLLLGILEIALWRIRKTIRDLQKPGTGGGTPPPNGKVTCPGCGSVESPSACCGQCGHALPQPTALVVKSPAPNPSGGTKTPSTATQGGTKTPPPPKKKPCGGF